MTTFTASSNRKKSMKKVIAFLLLLVMAVSLVAVPAVSAAEKIIYTFLESYDMSGKTIIPFCTSASSPIGTSATNLHALAPDAIWKDGRRFAAGTSSDVIEAWLNEIGF